MEVEVVCEKKVSNVNVNINIRVSVSVNVNANAWTAASLSCFENQVIKLPPSARRAGHQQHLGEAVAANAATSGHQLGGRANVL